MKKEPASMQALPDFGRPVTPWRLRLNTVIFEADTRAGRAFDVSLMMLMGWGTLAVPTGIVSAEFTAQRIRRTPTIRTCHECLSEGHTPAALPAWQPDAGSVA